MRNILKIILLLPGFALGQTKPRSADAVTPSASWQDRLVRAYLFSDADSAMIDSVKDWSSNNSWPNCFMFNDTSWHSNAEGTRYSFTGATASGISNSECLQMIRAPSQPSDTAGFTSFTNEITIASRVTITCAGTCGPLFSFCLKSATPINSVHAPDFDVDVSHSVWCFSDGSETCFAYDLTGGTQTVSTITIIYTFDGDSMRCYQDGSYKGASQKTITDILDYNEGYNPMVAKEAVSVANYRSGYVQVYMFAIWRRVINSSERTQIFNDPYVMWRAASSGTAGQVIMINSMLPPSPKFIFYLLLILSAIGAAAGIYRHFFYERKKIT